MSLHPINPDLVLQELDRRMSGWGNGEKLARVLEMDARHLRSIRSGSEKVTQKVAAGLGFELRWVKVKVGKGEQQDDRDRGNNSNGNGTGRDSEHRS
jgi:hypothetical protein